MRESSFILSEAKRLLQRRIFRYCIDNVHTYRNIVHDFTPIDIFVLYDLVLNCTVGHFRLETDARRVCASIIVAIMLSGSIRK